MRAMIWDFYLRLRRLTLSSELRKLSRAGSRSTFYNAAQSRGRRPRLQPFTDHRSRITTSFYRGGVGRGCGVGRGLGVALGVAVAVGVAVGVPVGVGLTVTVGVGVGVGPPAVVLRIVPKAPTAVPVFVSAKETL